jgi:hypothetical protein
VRCGEPVTTAGSCRVNVQKPVAVPVGQCVELTALRVSPPCPVGFSTIRSLTFRTTARTSRARLQWRRSADSSDVLEPSSGRVVPNGQTEVTLTDIVLDDRVRIEVVDGDDVVLRFTLRHY